MKKQNLPLQTVLVTFFCLLISTPCLALNILTVQDPDAYGSNPGYIDKARLIVEPHGAFVEQSLYLTYSDHEQYASGTQLEIVHRFELPQGAVVNDLWLWIGDSIMQAIMKDTWTARAIYDSIVAFKRDPAFLTKTGNQYELHIYPLLTGESRKIKLNYIVPTRWQGEKASVSLPLKMLQANNAPTQPLDILFRIQEDIWGEPVIPELPACEFTLFADTLQYHYKKTEIADIYDLLSLSLNFQTDFNDGYFFRSFIQDNSTGYFQFGIIPRTFFDLKIDSVQQNHLIGLDLSGAYNKNYELLIPRLQQTLEESMKEGDRFKFIVTGADRLQNFSPDWISVTPNVVKGMLDEFLQSELADEIGETRMPHILYCDHHSAICWKFPGIDEMATYEEQQAIQNCIERFQHADIIATYDEGNHNPPNDTQLNQIVTALKPFFARGGRLLCFFDYNRVGNERIGRHYIPGLTTNNKAACDLYPNQGGNIAHHFPSSVYHHVVNFLEYDDPDVKIELMDQQERPAVISKQIQNGLLIISGIWAFKDDGALRALLGVPLLGLGTQTEHRQLAQLLEAMQEIHHATPANKALIFSNSDSLIQTEDANNWLVPYLQGFTTAPLVFSSVNLLDGSTIQPPSITVENVDYYGSGYLLKSLADKTDGMHFESHIFDWNFIANTLSPFTIPQRKSLNLDVVVDGGAGEMLEQREVAPVLNDANKPVFFIGSANGNEFFQFNIAAEFKGLDSIIHRQLDLPISTDTLRVNKILPDMLAYENLKDLLNHASYDTAAIVKLAIRHNLLCDYTALIALEPNDSLFFMKYPFDEGIWTTVQELNISPEDSLEFNLFPNPFNERITLALQLPEPADVKIMIFNIRGQLVNEIFVPNAFSGSLDCHWDGRAANGKNVSSGIYFARAIVRFTQTERVKMKLKRMLLLK